MTDSKTRETIAGAPSKLMFAPREVRGPDPFGSTKPMTDLAKKQFGDNFDPVTGLVTVYCQKQKKWLRLPAVDARDALYGPRGFEEGWKTTVSLVGPEE